MKSKNYILSLLSILILAGCQGGKVSSTNKETSSSSVSSTVISSTTSSTTSTTISSSSTVSSSSTGVQYSTDTDLLISEYVEGTGLDKAIEVYNFSDKEVDLSEYAINQYRSDYVPTVTVPLQGKLAPKETYVIAYEGSSEEVTSKADLLDIGLYFTGKNAISLTKNGKVVDIIGYIGYAIDYAKDMTLVRKVDQMYPRHDFDEYDWIRYAPDNFNYLGDATNSCTPEELLAGPVLEEKYTDLAEYPIADGTLGAGGAFRVSIKNNIDGDTTDLYVENSTVNPRNFMHNQSYYGTDNGKYWLRVRYQAVDTPESYPGNIQEFGITAKYYTAFLQNKADQIYLQSVLGDSLVCNYGRFMGYVWAGTDTLVNFESIKHGYSTITFNFHYDLTSRDIPYESYMYNAMLYAKRNKLGLYGEKDPYWNYDTNSSYCEGSKNCENMFETGKPF